MRIATQKGISVFCAIASLSFASLAISSKNIVTSAITVNPDGVVDVPIDALAVNATTDTEMRSIRIPMVARQLHGMRVRIHGVMYPTFNETGLTEFFLIQETNQRPKHWMSSNIPLHAAIPIKIALGQTEDYEEQPITVEGVFEVHIQDEDQQPIAIYRLTDAKVVAKKIRLRGTPAIAMFGC